jgi:hypothetical protein
MNAMENDKMTPKVKFRIEYTSGSYELECCRRSYYKLTLNDRLIEDSDFTDSTYHVGNGEVCASRCGPKNNNAYFEYPYYAIALSLLKESNPDLVPDEDMPEELRYELPFNLFDIHFQLVHPDLVQISISSGRKENLFSTEETLLNTVHELLSTCSQVSQVDRDLGSDEKRIMQHALEGLGCEPSIVEGWLEW